MPKRGKPCDTISGPKYQGEGFGVTRKKQQENGKDGWKSERQHHHIFE
jgi:hypothetical protein